MNLEHLIAHGCKDGLPDVKAYTQSVVVAVLEEVEKRVEEKEREWGTIAEKADTYFQKGEEKEGYSLAKAEEDVDTYGAKAYAATIILYDIATLKKEIIEQKK